MKDNDAKIVVLIGDDEAFPVLEARWFWDDTWKVKDLSMPKSYRKKRDKDSRILSWKIRLLGCHDEFDQARWNIYREYSPHDPSSRSVFPYFREPYLATMAVKRLKRKKVIKQLTIPQMRMVDVYRGLEDKKNLYLL